LTDIHKGCNNCCVRPREKIVKYGVENLTDSELVAVIIRTGSRKRACSKLADYLVNKGKVLHVPRLAPADLTKLEGVGLAKACALVAALELGLRVKLPGGFGQRQFLKPTDFASLLEEYRYSKKEHVVGFYLNGRCNLLHRELLFLGSFDSVEVKAVDVFDPAITHKTSTVILAHNHPSGDSNPSASDIEITKDLIKAGDILGLKLLDHLIVSDQGLFSFKARGLMKF